MSYVFYAIWKIFLKLVDENKKPNIATIQVDYTQVTPHTVGTKIS